MNFNAAAAFLLATASSVRAGQVYSRRSESRGLEALSTELGYAESLGECNGAKCGLWGDPHIDTCDGLIYDCQGVGIYTLMKNFAFNVEGNFVDVSAEDRQHIIDTQMDLPLGASLTNDIIIDFLPDESVPTFQFGFGDLSNHDGTFPGEDGCTVNWTYKPPNMPGEKKSKEANVEQCRARCDNTPGCTGFSYWSDSMCHVVDDSSVLEQSEPHWSRAVSGTVDSTCGTHHPDMELADREERMKHGFIGVQCPLLMWEDGVLKDISDVIKKGYLYGDKDADFKVQLKNGKKIEITYTMPDGQKAVILMIAEGDGPGELWSCHWDFWICLPASYEEQFNATTVGLLGSPDNDPYNDWMDTEGNVLDLIYEGPERHDASLGYCVDNWCLGEDETMMSYHGNTTYEDYACANNTHREFDVSDPDCVLSADKIEQFCQDVTPFALQACQVDCCLGGCEVLPDLDRPETPIDAPTDDFFGGCLLERTPSTVCPSAEGGTIVKLLSTTGTESIPAGEEVFHSIYQNPDPDDNGSTTVKFKLNNPFNSNADAFVKHDKNVLTTFTESVCEGFEFEPSSCGTEQFIEVACKEFPGVEPFALVNVYFASDVISDGGDVAIDQCCEAEEYGAEVGIVEYTFQIECKCPTSSTQ